MRIALVLALLSATAAAEPAPAAKVELVTLEAQPTIVRTVKAAPDALGSAIAGAVLSLIATADQHSLAIVGPPFARYVARGKRVQVEVGVPVRKAAAGKQLGKDIRAGELPAGPAATLMFRGRHDDLARGHALLDAWLVNHDWKAAAPRWEVYVTNPVQTPDPTSQQTRIVVPLAPY
jgi:AraC family transcriptional regulator